MNGVDVRCPRCGAIMAQKGAERSRVAYHCNCCGHNEFVELKNEDNSDYWMKRAALLGRVRHGIIDWDTTGWDYLMKDILDFTQNYEAARFDIYFKISMIACLTKGFHNMKTAEYRECKRIFKVTEKVYKRYCKDPDAKKNFESETGADGILEYEEYRQLYKKCLYDYRCTQLLWKVLFSLGKKLVPIPKF